MNEQEPKNEQEITREEAAKRLEGCLGSLQYMINVEQNSIGKQVNEQDKQRLNKAIEDAEKYLQILKK